MEKVFLAVQDHTGDSKLKLTWDKNDVEAKKVAQKTFLDLKEKGYRIFSVKKVLGFINFKGKELDSFSPEDGEFYYQEGDRKVKKSQKQESVSTFTMEDVEADNIRYENAKVFDPTKEEVDTAKDYVATKPFHAG